MLVEWIPSMRMVILSRVKLMSQQSAYDFNESTQFLHTHQFHATRSFLHLAPLGENRLEGISLLDIPGELLVPAHVNAVHLFVLVQLLLDALDGLKPARPVCRVLHMERSLDHSCHLQPADEKGERFGSVCRHYLTTWENIFYWPHHPPGGIILPLTVKLLSGSLRSWALGFDLNPINCPSSLRIKYLCRQFLMCSPKS